MKNSLYHRTIKLLENEHLEINLESASLIYKKLIEENGCDGNCKDINCSCSKFSEDRKNFYVQSGLKFIFNNLIEKKHIKDNLKFVFIENSNLPSSILDSELDAFSMTWEDNNESSFQNVASIYFKPIIKALQESENALFWHKDFFQEPHTGQAILTFNHYLDRTRFHNRKNLLDTLKSSLNKLNENKDKLDENKDPINLKTDYFECFDDEIITSVYTTLGNIELNYEKFKKKISDNEITTPPTVLHSLNHHLYDIFFRYDNLIDCFLEPELQQTIEGIKKYYNVEKYITEDKDGINTVFLSIPILCANPLATSGGEATLIGFGALFVYLGFRDSLDNFLIIDELQEFATNITTHIRSFSQGLVFNINNKQTKIIESNATRAAISQVMARNMSHNIGSHVLSKLITDDAIKELFFKNKKSNKEVFSDSFSEYIEFYQCLNKIEDVDWKNTVTTCESEITNEKLVAGFFNYLKTRMDFLADITTSTPVIENTKELYSDILSPFLQNRVLNDKISGISDFKYEIILCKPPIDHHLHCINHATKECFNTENIINSKNNDIKVSIPNDVVGIHALYTILENIIRNTAKHATMPDSKIVEFTIKVQEARNLFVDKKNELNLNEYKAVSIFDNCDKIDDLNKLVEKQNEWLNASILDNSQLRHGHWGLIEMDASAAYLRKVSVEQIDSEDYDINDVTGATPVTKKQKLCIFQAYAEQEKYLGYRFYLRKPQEVLIIVNETEDKGIIGGYGESIDNLENKGIWIKTIAAIEDDLKNNNASPHRLIVITPSAITINDKLVNNPLFSKRIVRVDEIFRDFSNINKMWSEFYTNASEYNNPDKNIKNIKGLNDSITDNHGTNYCKNLFGNNNEKGYKFVEIRFTATDHFFKSENNYKSSWPIKIGIIDERIQAFCKEKYPIQVPTEDCPHKNTDKCFHNGGAPYSQIYKNTNILLPSIIECNLNAQLFDKEFDKIIVYIQILTNTIHADSEKGNGLDELPCEFVVIHIGVIEKLITSYNRTKLKIGQNYYDKEKPLVIKEFLLKEVLQLKDDCNETRKIYDSIVLTSGRGKPHNLPEDIRYVNFSTISQYLITQRNKYALTEALYSARKQFKN